MTICKAFLGPHFDYGDVVLDQAFYNSFHLRLQSIQYIIIIIITIIILIIIIIIAVVSFIHKKN